MNKDKQKRGAERDPKTGQFLSGYKPEFDAMLLAHLSEGLSFRSFAAVVDVNEDTIFSWVNAHKTFAEAKAIGTNKSLLIWERMGMTGLHEKGFNTAVWIFNMKNRFGWRDRQEVKNLNPGEDFPDINHTKIMNYIEGKEF